MDQTAFEQLQEALKKRLITVTIALYCAWQQGATQEQIEALSTSTISNVEQQ